MRLCLALLAAPLLAACAATEPPAPGTISIMTFNVENLFDTVDDPGKNDETFLPLAAKQNGAHREKCAEIDVERWREQCLNWDWGEEVLERKLEVVARTVLQVDDGRGPDIVALQEVENIRVLDRLRREHLAAAGYFEPVLVEGDDRRGIDVAFLTRLPLAAPPGLHPVPVPGKHRERAGDTRGILEATFVLPDGSLLTGFSVHFPAPYHPTAMRVSAFRTLNALLGRLPPDRPAFAAGDFNTTSAEDRRLSLLERLVRDRWSIAHQSGCRPRCPGTSYYRRDGTWSFLDMLLWSPSRAEDDAGDWRLLPRSTRLVNDLPAQRLPDGTPARFDPRRLEGVSDHWPMLMRIGPAQSGD